MGRGLGRGVDLGVDVGVTLGVTVEVAVGVAVAVGVGVAVGVAVGVGLPDGTYVIASTGGLALSRVSNRFAMRNMDSSPNINQPKLLAG